MAKIARIALSGKSGYNSIHTRVSVLVTQINFNSVIPIYYARTGIQRHTKSYVLPSAENRPTAPSKYYRFSLPAQRPKKAEPHWKKETVSNEAACSWPAVYTRNGAREGTPAYLKASFMLAPNRMSARLFHKNKSNIKIWAEGDHGLKLKPKNISFTDGIAENIIFEVEGLPSTVKHLDGFTFTWKYTVTDLPQLANSTRHTLFVVGEKPRRANLDLIGNMYLWDVLVWSCGWANGTTGAGAILNSIWKQFHPVSASHSTGLIYWKDYKHYRPHNRLFHAINSQDDVFPRDANSASCIVFARILINCLAAHGIASAEIQLSPQLEPFIYKGKKSICKAWNDTTTVGQGNPEAPPGWETHWIAAVNLDEGLGDEWAFYDASYGCGPVKSAAARSKGPHNVFAFEPFTVETWCAENDNFRFEVPRTVDPTVPPHLVGEILWQNYI